MDQVASRSQRVSLLHPLTRMIVTLSAGRRTFPRRTIRKLVKIKRLGLHLDTVSRIERRHVTSIFHRYRINEMFVQVNDVLHDSIIERSAHGDVIKQRKMLDIFAKSDAARMRANRHPVFRRHENHCQYFIHSRETATVDLAKTDRIGLHQLFEDHSILTSLAGGHADWGDRFGYLRVP